jgi:prephenate dehydrogenase
VILQGIPELRKKIDQIDREIAKNLKARVHLCRKIGLTKRQLRIPVRDIKREKEKCISVMSNAESLGLDPHDVRSIHERIVTMCTKVQESTTHQFIDNSQLSLKSSKGERAMVKSNKDLQSCKLRITVIGAGKMGQWFAKFFRTQNCSVIVSDKNKNTLAKIKKELNLETCSTTKAIIDADWIFICVPIKDFENVLQEIGPHVRENQVVLDICSLKEHPVRAMHDYIQKGVTLGTHPMFGPDTENLQDKNFILTPTNIMEKEFASTLKVWLGERGAKVVILSPRNHDDLMSKVLVLPHFLGVAISETLLECANLTDTVKVAGPSYMKLLAFAKSVVSQDPNLYASLQVETSGAVGIENLFCRKALKLMEVVKQKDELSFADKMREASKLLDAITPSSKS